ncbi:hypothetical protein E2F47_22200 [Mycobacterium eburneum]|nr:hypothetical protein [Mycobacterium eburneum]TDH48880.1 hypothetical protein E2F47_22200 [Mycobacterium eburneum]
MSDHIAGVLTTEHRLTAEDCAAVRERFKALTGASAVVLDNGWNFIPTAVNLVSTPTAADAHQTPARIALWLTIVNVCVSLSAVILAISVILAGH